jgi:hypothetical protein
MDRDVGDSDSDVCEKQPYVEQKLEDLHDPREILVAGLCCNLDVVSGENLAVLEDQRNE